MLLRRLALFIMKHSLAKGMTFALDCAQAQLLCPLLAPLQEDSCVSG